MTREELIQQAATDYEKTIIVDHFSCDTEIDFSEGARWADANPPGWIKIEDGCEMPPLGRMVEVYFPLYENIFLDYRHKFNDGKWSIDPLNGQGEPSHWRYLRPAPKAEQ